MKYGHFSRCLNIIRDTCWPRCFGDENDIAVNPRDPRDADAEA